MNPFFLAAFSALLGLGAVLQTNLAMHLRINRLQRRSDLVRMIPIVQRTVAFENKA